ncbi:MAG TPA: deoxyguanosinetriphosphate triphosphohydrolase [Candidatus Aminicenantes bacterium]|nr:deoxyguanosinetriphosphate triphosphohydrolase [Candidatus Aminicenantes bacterium]
MAGTIREKLEQLEKETLSEKACLSLNTRGREREEQLHSLRTEFQRDRDRIIHCKSFRRLKHKTQVFIAPYGDHYRTRLTHTLEVSQIARTIAKALRLNEDLTEAIALGHDLGHTPFGHAGEKALKKLSPRRFSHYTQSLRVVEKLEYDGKGLNLTFEVRDGILKHSKGRGKIFDVKKEELPMTLEGQVVRVSDLIAYVNHDIDDALRAGVISEQDIPSRLVLSLGRRHAKRIDKMVWDVIDSTSRGGLISISLSEDMNQTIVALRDFLYERVYFSEQNLVQYRKVDKILTDLYEYILAHPDDYVKSYPEEDMLEIRVIDTIAGMTDFYALNLYNKLFLPNHRTKF